MRTRDDRNAARQALLDVGRAESEADVIAQGFVELCRTIDDQSEALALLLNRLGAAIERMSAR